MKKPYEPKEVVWQRWPRKPKMLNTQTSGTPFCSECLSWPCICPPKDVYIIGQPGGDNGGA